MEETETDASAEAAPAPEPQREGGPNWMLAFVCLVAGATSLSEAYHLIVPGFHLAGMEGQAFLGYGLLGAGLLSFAAEALQWGKRRHGVPALLSVLVPALLTLAGVIYLLLSHDPGRRI